MRDAIWLAVGLVAQLLFFGRFIVQWLVSERRGQSTIPEAFWYFSLAGGVLLLAYSISRHDPIFILGQSLGLLVYVRNLMLIARRQSLLLVRAAPWLALAAFALVMGLVFIGTRGLWEPDEGRYAECAREMLATGDFMTPRLGAEPHFTKPPVTYWMIAASMSAFGANEIAVRLPTALCFAGTVLLIALFGRALWDRRTGLLAGVVYATFVASFAAANIVTPDTPLTFWEALALFAFWRGFTTDTTLGRRLWPALTGAALGVAMMVKGPAGLLFLPAMLLFRSLPAGRRAGAAPVLSFAGVALFGALGLSWYVWSVLHHPGLLTYLVRDEVLGRIAGAHHRNHQWYGPLVIYLPTLIVGTLPWCLTWPSLVRRWRADAGDEPLLAAIARRPRTLMLALAIVVPLLILCLVRSRLPLYLLPLFVPLALATARHLASATPATERRPGWLGTMSPAWARALPAWIAILIAGRAAFAAWPSPADARALYRSLPRGHSTELVLADSRPHYGLAFYYARENSGEVEYSWIHRVGAADPPAGIPLDAEIVEESVPSDHSHVFLVADADWRMLEGRLHDVGATVRERLEVRGEVAVLTASRVAQTGAAVHAVQ